MDGILNINKPIGNTSFSIVAMVKRLTRERRVGHAGTLDPIASGVLPVCFGQGTRVIEFLQDARKIYRTQISLGVATDSYDATGKIVWQGEYKKISQRHVERALSSFSGLIWQTPPMYSALKYQGKRLYQLARAGIMVNRASRPARIHRCELIGFQPPLITVEIECGKGTYIRSLTHDLGKLLGCGAHIKELTRLSYGPFNIEEAVSMIRLEDALSSHDFQHLVYPIDSVMNNWSIVVVGDEQERIIKNGGSIVIQRKPTDSNGEKRCCAYSKNGNFLAVLFFNAERGYWHPDKVFV